MAGVSLLTALSIASNYPENISIHTKMGDDSMCYFELMLMRDGQIHTCLVSGAAKGSEQDTKEYLSNFCEQIKEKYQCML